MIFDTHAHYDDEAFEEDRGALIASLAEQGIGRVVNVAADLASVSTSLTLAQQYPFIYAAVGVHPSNVQELTERDYEWLEEKLAAPKAVAVGEIGLDYYWDKEPDVQARQRESFSRQLQLAKKLDKPVIIHSRDAAKDTLDVMAAEGGSQLRAHLLRKAAVGTAGCKVFLQPAVPVRCPEFLAAHFTQHLIARRHLWERAPLRAAETVDAGLDGPFPADCKNGLPFFSEEQDHLAAVLMIGQHGHIRVGLLQRGQRMSRFHQHQRIGRRQLRQQAGVLPLQKGLQCAGLAVRFGLLRQL